MSFNRKIVIVLTMLLLLVWGGISGAFLYAKFGKQNHERFVKFEGIDNDNKDGTNDNRRYFSDEIILQAKDRDLAIFIYSSRREVTTGFSHFYKVDIRENGGQTYETSDGFVSDSKEVIQNGSVFTEFQNQLATDISARESYKLKLANFNLTINLPELSSNFIIKNQPEYTKYAAVGEGEVDLNGQRVEVYAYLTKIYSTDSSKFIFFDGLNSMKLENYQLIFWDQAGNFYLADRSDVETQNPAYTSHAWLLRKTADGAAYKAFDFKGSFNPSEGSWQIEFKDIPQTFNLRSRADRIENTDFELLEGDNGIRGVYAYYLL